MASPYGKPSDRKKLRELIAEVFGFLASVIAIFAFLGMSIISAALVLFVFFVIVIIYLFNESRSMQKEVEHLRSNNKRLQKMIAERSTIQEEKSSKAVAPSPVRKKTTVSAYLKPKKILPDILPKKTPHDIVVRPDIVLDKKFGLGYDEYKEYALELRKNAKVRVHTESTECINVYFLDKWHFDRTEMWNKTQWMDTSIYEYDETIVIPKAGKWFIVCEALEQPADVVLAATIIEEGEEEKKPGWLRIYKA